VSRPGIRTIRVIDTSVIKSGETNGKPWALYEITATNLNGEPIDKKLKSFTKLEGDVEVEIEEQDHEKYGVSYMLKPVGGANAGSPSPGARLGPKVDELRGRIEHLEAQVDHLSSLVTGVQQLVHQLAREGEPVSAGAPDPTPSDGGPAGARFGGDDDIPF
jgi:hypothetical protein